MRSVLPRVLPLLLTSALVGGIACADATAPQENVRVPATAPNIAPSTGVTTDDIAPPDTTNRNGYTVPNG